MKILKFIAILALPLLLSNCAKEEIEPSGLKDMIVGHWQSNEYDYGNGKRTYNYSFADDGKFAYWYTYRQQDGTNDPNPDGDLTGEWTVFGADKIGLSYKRPNIDDFDETKSEIITVLLAGDKAEILDFSRELRTYKRQ